LTRSRRILGEDHPDALASANNLAVRVAVLGDHEQARRLDADTLARLRRILGDDHADTLGSAGNLALGLDALGRTDEARRLREDTEASRAAAEARRAAETLPP